jgi:hypothetical protein
VAVVDEDGTSEGFLEALVCVVEFLEVAGVAAPVRVEDASSGAERSVEVGEAGGGGHAEELEVSGVGTGSHACSLFFICWR